MQQAALSPVGRDSRSRLRFHPPRLRRGGQWSRRLAFTDFQSAKDALLASIRSGGRYVLFTGESGAGKTTLLRAVRHELDRSHARIVYFNLARLSPAGLVRVLARHLRVPPSRRRSSRTSLATPGRHGSIVKRSRFSSSAVEVCQACSP